MSMSKLFDKNVRDSFLKAYRGWVDFCRPQRIKTGNCSGCPLDDFHWTSICYSFQEIGRSFDKSIKNLVSNLITEKDIRDRNISDLKEFLTRYDCPGPDLLQSSEKTQEEGS